ncbi:MAG: cytochrome P450 [Bryobacteraceae bacterium]
MQPDVVVAGPKLPPGPKGWPVLGVYPEFRTDPASFLLRVARDYGDIAFFKMGPQSVYLLSRPDYVQDILVTQSSRFTKSRILQRSKVLLGEGLLTSEGKFHLRQRRLAQPAFHRDRLAAYASSMTECAMRVQSRWREGQIYDMSEEMMRLTLAVVARTLFSKDVEAEARQIGQAMTDVLATFDTLLLPFSTTLQRLPLPAFRRAERARGVLDTIIYKIIGERRASGEDRGDLLSMLLLAQDEEEHGERMSDKQIRDEALTLFLAGHETTANALTWTWYLLAQNPEAEARLQEEWRTVLSGRVPTFDDIPKLRYTEMVLAEALRIYPPAWAMSRLVVQNYNAGGYDIPPGSVCSFSQYVIHRKPEYFPEPEAFRPERWTPEAREARPKFSYFPFGGGPRVCIGERFAWMEGVLLIAAIGQHWSMKLASGHKVEPRAQITLRPRYGMRMALERLNRVRL